MQPACLDMALTRLEKLEAAAKAATQAFRDAGVE